MHSNSTKRAIGPKVPAMSGQSPQPKARFRPDHAAQHGSGSPRQGAAKAPGSVSMDYQQGFFSGPSS